MTDWLAGASPACGLPSSRAADMDSSLLPSYPSGGPGGFPGETVWVPVTHIPQESPHRKQCRQNHRGLLRKDPAEVGVATPGALDASLGQVPERVRLNSKKLGKPLGKQNGKRRH